MPGSLMKALIRPGSGDATPIDGDQVITFTLIVFIDNLSFSRMLIDNYCICRYCCS